MKSNVFKDKKITLVGPWPPPYGGMATALMMIHAHLKDEGATVYKLDDFHSLRDIPKTLIQYSENIRKTDIILIFTTGYKAFYRSVMTILLGKLFRKRVIIMVESSFGRFIRSFHRFLAIPVLRLVDVISIYSPYQEKLFRQYGLKTEIISDFVPDFFKFTNTQRISPVILMSKSLMSYSNHKCGIKAFKIIKSRFPDARLLITSTGPLEKELKGLVEKLGLSDVIFLGDIRYGEMQRIYEESTILLHTTNRDIFPRTILEAFVTGVVVVATRVQGIPYMVENNVNGLLVEADNHEEAARKVIYLLENPQEIERIRTRAKQIADVKYSWNGYKERLAKIFDIIPPS